MEATASRYDDRIAELCQWFEDAEMQSAPSRRLAERDRDYRDHIQWTPEELRILAERKQPALTINYVSRKVDLLLGLERRQRGDPKVLPRTPGEDDRAYAATQALRYVVDDSRFDDVKSLAYENILVEGYGGCKVVVEDAGNGEPRIAVKHVPWDRIFVDPHSRAPDFSDARFMGEVIWMDRAEAAEMFPDAGDVLDATFGIGYSDTYDDRPADAWTDKGRSRVRIVQMHYRERGEWMTATFTKGGAVSPTVVSPYLDRFGKSCCPMILRGAYMNRKNERYGMVRMLVSLQDEINKRRSKALHWANSRQIVLEQGAVQDVDATREQLARPDGVVLTNPGMKWEMLPSGEFTQAQMELLAHATAEMQASGPNASMAGKDPRALSGKAIQAQQAGGSLEVEPLVDELRQWSRRVYEAIWMRIRQYWTAEKWVRVTDDVRNMQWVGLNRPIKLKDELAALPEQERAMQMQMLGLVPNDPRLEQVVRVENAIGELDADITVEQGPDLTTLQSEQFQALVQMAQSGVMIPPDVLIAASSLRNKDDLLKRMEAAAQQQMQMAQMQAQSAMQKAEAETRRANADAAKKEAEAGMAAASGAIKQMDAAAIMSGIAPAPAQAPAIQAETQLRTAMMGGSRGE